jgi:hypothetical protein
MEAAVAKPETQVVAASPRFAKFDQSMRPSYAVRT